MTSVRIKVPATIANVGIGFGIWSLAVKEPYLWVEVEKIQKKKDEFVIDSKCKPPKGRILGYTGQKAVQHLVEEYNLAGHYRICMKDNGFPVGGIGRSSAEAVGALLGVACLNELPLTREKAIDLTSDVEPNKGTGNVSGAIGGGFTVIYTDNRGRIHFENIELPKCFGVALGISSYPKTMGTEGGQKVLKSVSVLDLPIQFGRISAASIALAKGDLQKFICLTKDDVFYEPVRADSGIYGDLKGKDFLVLKGKLHKEFNVALVASGAGPSMAFLYNRDEHPKGLDKRLCDIVVEWFQDRQINLKMMETKVAKSGAYDYIVNKYGYRG